MSAPIYKFSLDSFHVLETRARVSDTDYVTFSLKTGNGTTRTQTRSMGDVGDDAAPAVGLVFDGVSVGSNDAVVATYLIVNSGHSSPSAIEKDLESAAEKVVIAGTAAAVAAISATEGAGIAAAVSAAVGAVVGSAGVPVLGTALGAFIAWVFTSIGELLAANCDGPVATEVMPFTGRDLWAKTARGPIKMSTDHPGVDSAAGCGSNSHYVVNWSVERSIRTNLTAIVDSTRNLQLFAVGEDGHVYGAWLTPGKSWEGWIGLPVPDPGVFSQGTTVTAVEDSAHNLQLFAVGENGHVYAAWLEPGKAWKGWTGLPVPNLGVFDQGTNLTAIVDGARNLQLFAVGENGRVFAAWLEPGKSWAGWNELPVPSLGVFSEGTTLTAVNDSAGNLRLFGVGGDGRLYTAWLTPGKGWGGWERLGNPSVGVFSQGATVTAINDSAGNLRLFAVDEDGRVYTASLEPGKSWQDWAPLPVPNLGVFNQGTTVTAVEDSAHNLQLFAVGKDGRVYAAWLEPGKSWAGWSGLPAPNLGVFSQGAPLTAIVDSARNLQLFAVGENGHAYAAWLEPGKSWAGWNGLPVPNLGVFSH